MNTKTLVGGLAGGVIFFILGYLVYGRLLSGFYEARFNQCMAKDMEEFSWWAVVAFNFVWGFFFAVVLNWADAKNLTDGLKVGAIAGFLISLGFALQFYSMTTMYLAGGLPLIGTGVVIDTVFNAVGAGLIAVVMSRL